MVCECGDVVVGGGDERVFGDVGDVVEVWGEV